MTVVVRVPVFDFFGYPEPKNSDKIQSRRNKFEKVEL